MCYSLNDLLNTTRSCLYIFAMSKGKKYLQIIKLQVLNE